MRKDGRQENELRPITMIRDFTDTKGGSVLISWGNTRVLCTALLEEGTMPFLKGTGKGWLTAEYAMLPSSTGNRKKRDYLKQDGRSTEIQRLIGRSLRAGVDLEKLGERVIYVDCDVLQADGGTRQGDHDIDLDPHGRWQVEGEELQAAGQLRLQVVPAHLQGDDGQDRA